MQNNSPIEIKISTVVGIIIIIYETDPTILELALNNITNHMTDLFEDEITILDVGFLNTVNIKWNILVTLFKRFHFNVVAIRNASPELYADIITQGLSIDNRVSQSQISTLSQKLSISKLTNQARLVSPKIMANASVIIDTPVRTGQRIYARNQDLVVMEAVNSGAEIISDGSIHVYAPLRGRALAGASGNINARIFVTRLEAELVSISGIYRTFENENITELIQQHMQIRLRNGQIDILPIHYK